MTIAHPVVPPGLGDVWTFQDTLLREGIVGLPGSFPPLWADDVHADFEAAFAAARSYPQGTIGRGPQRYYFAVPPERVRRFVDLVTHPAVTALSSAVLGPDYRFVEFAFDVPLPGAVDQPWHRDFRMPAQTREQGRLTSLAFNVTTVDVTVEMAPFEVAPGTHWDADDDFAYGMFPSPASAARYTALGRRRYPQRGDMSARTGLTLHRGTANLAPTARPVLVLGVIAGDVEPEEVHELVMTREYYDRLPDTLRPHLHARVVDELRPLVQKHDIEGLMMG